jgi:hypothetical protein
MLAEGQRATAQSQSTSAPSQAQTGGNANLSA